jgi:hypothetical protein
VTIESAPPSASLRLAISELPFVEKRLVELLHLDEDRPEPSREYAGFGWSRSSQLWLESADGEPHLVAHALVLALHTADDADELAGDIDLEFELADGPVIVRASKFLEVWLPMLPRAPSTVLALCNPHAATLARPRAAEGAVWYGLGDVASWREDGERVILTADSWRRL